MMSRGDSLSILIFAPPYFHLPCGNAHLNWFALLLSGPRMSEATLDSVAAVATIAVTILVLHALARRSAPIVDGTTEPLTGHSERVASGGSGEFTPLADPSTWRSKTVSDLSTAEELLDRAEAEGYQDREMIVLGNSSFLVRWRRQE
jgi:hypothetical protein